MSLSVSGYIFSFEWWKKATVNAGLHNNYVANKVGFSSVKSKWDNS